MAGETIIVPVDGASNLKLEALDLDTLSTVHSVSSESPLAEHEGFKYVNAGQEFGWFDEAVRSMPGSARSKAAVIAPVCRGATGGLVDAENRLMEVEGESYVLAYVQTYPEEVEERFRQIAGSKQNFYLQTGAIRDLPGSLTLLKRFVFEEQRRPQLVSRASAFGHLGALVSGHFLGDDYLKVIRTCGNEHSYWMCHTGARNVHSEPGSPSTFTEAVDCFWKLVPRRPSVVYEILDRMPDSQAEALGLSGRPGVVCGGHDTCLSHIPVLSTFYQAFPSHEGKPVIQVEAGTWTMIAQIGGTAKLPNDGYEKDILVQGTVDGEPVVTARYGGGGDFAYLKALLEKKGLGLKPELDEELQKYVASGAEVFVLPNINAQNHGTGPFPNLKGRIVGKQKLFEDPVYACIVMNLTTASTAAYQLEVIAQDKDVPVVVTAGGAKDPYFGRLIATLTGRKVYAMFDKEGEALTETTTLGAAVAGKAAYLNIHPYKVDVSGLGIRYKELEPFRESQDAIKNYSKQLIDHVRREEKNSGAAGKGS